MNFDKDEDTLDIQYNIFINTVKKMEWLLEELEMKEARIKELNE